MSSKISKTCCLIFDFFRLFFSMSSLHGFAHLAEKKRHPIEIIIWISLVVSAIYGTAILSSKTLTRYQENPTVISMERDRFSWNTSFPAATICPEFKLNQALLDEYVEQSKTKNKTLLRDFLVSLAEATYANFDSIVNYHEIPAEQYMKILLELQFVFKPSVSNSGLNNHQYFLTQSITEMGICYCFNCHLAIYNSPQYWNNGSWKILPENDTFYVNPLDGEVFANVINMSTGFKVKLIRELSLNP